jgi:hypothetical protein
VTSCAGANKSGWSAFLRHLVDRGLKGVRLVISDACRGLVESVADFLPEGRYQRCMVHFYRNVFSQVPSTRVRQVSRMLKAIHAQESRDAADQNQQSAGADHERDQAQRCRRSRRSSRAGSANIPISGCGYTVAGGSTRSNPVAGSGSTSSSSAMRRSISPITRCENGPRCMYSAISMTM